jgi:hypothetical protein
MSPGSRGGVPQNRRLGLFRAQARCDNEELTRIPPSRLDERKWSSSLGGIAVTDHSPSSYSATIPAYAKLPRTTLRVLPAPSGSQPSFTAVQPSFTAVPEALTISMLFPTVS